MGGFLLVPEQGHHTKGASKNETQMYKMGCFLLVSVSHPTVFLIFSRMVVGQAFNRVPVRFGLCCRWLVLQSLVGLNMLPLSEGNPLEEMPRRELSKTSNLEAGAKGFLFAILVLLADPLAPWL